MMPETAKAKLKMEEQSREELITLTHEMAKMISELKAEIAQLKQPPTISQNSSQPPSRFFQSVYEEETQAKQEEKRQAWTRKTRTSVGRQPEQSHGSERRQLRKLSPQLIGSSSIASNTSSDYRTA
jgi:hypothetical protein